MISAIALLAVILAVTAFLAFPRPAETSQSIPVTGLSYADDPIPYQLERQIVALNPPLTSKWDDLARRAAEK